MHNLSASEIDRERLSEIAAQSIAKLDPKTESGKRWINAIARAVAEIENNPYLTWQADSHSLLIMSLNSTGNIYQANGSCQCRAFELNQPCWHRALARLIERYLEQ